MLIPRVMPCLLVKNGRLVKTVRFRKPSYVGDPVNAIKIYNDKEVDELIILDIAATVEKRKPNFDLIREVADECFMPVCYGGGVSSIDEMKMFFGLGIEKVSINTHSFNNPDLIYQSAKVFGSQSIIVSIDVKKNIFGKYRICTHSGTKASTIDVIDYAQMVEKLGAGEILLNPIDRDGTWDGFDLDLINMVTDVVNVPVIALGGAGNLSDIADAVHRGGASAVAIGSMAVYQAKNLGVLVNFPSREKLINIFS